MYIRDAHLVFRDAKIDRVYIIPICIDNRNNPDSIEVVESIYEYEYIVEILNNYKAFALVAFMDNKYNLAIEMVGEYTEIYLLNEEGGYEILTPNEVQALAKKESSGPKYILAVDNEVQEVLFTNENILNLAEKIKEAYHKPVQIYKGYSKILEDYFEEDFDDLSGRETIIFIEEI